MSLAAQLRGADVQWIERRQLDVEHARRDAHVERYHPLMTIEAPALSRPVGARYDRQFYTGMAIAAAVVVFVGFAPTYFLRASETSLPTYLQVHGFFFTTDRCSSPRRRWWRRGEPMSTAGLVGQQRPSPWSWSVSARPPASG